MCKRYIVVLAVLFVAQGCRRAELPESLHTSLGKAPSFSLTDQAGKKFSTDDLKGKTWVVNFFFARCLGDCPTMMDNTAELHRQFAENDNVMFVSISLDPVNDSPATLTAYAQEKNADTKRWRFLTGDEKYIFELVEKKFRQSVVKKKNADPGLAIVHTFFMIIVDNNGEMVGYIRDGRKKEQAANLGQRIHDLMHGSLLNRLYQFPTINASLNCTSGILLLIGLIAVKKRRLTFHKACMFTAFVVSIIFFASYLFYHAIILKGRSIGFGGDGIVRYVYYSVLITHIFLAALTLPLAIITVRLGLRDDRTRHRRIARWTFPIWLYVSVTGVVIYVMLYHLYPPA